VCFVLYLGGSREINYCPHLPISPITSTNEDDDEYALEKELF
jgi:hypothetical protein